MDSERLAKLYRERFETAETISKKNKLWKVLCNEFFQKFVPPDSTVLDIGAGYCEFINNINAKQKYAVDMNPDIIKFANKDVKIYTGSANDLVFLPDNSIDVIFMSNFLEHLRTKEDILLIFSAIHRVSKPAGSLMILQPNIRYAYKNYWDFFDHHLPISDKSLVEALAITGFKIKTLYPQFLPYTTKSKLPQSSLLVKLYIRMPFMWHIFGQQVFVQSQKLE
jgi:ubiquinone/menaquinone biosynthesis C-methylase UbiE